MKKRFCIALGLLSAFVLWTTAVRHIDVQPIGPQNSAVGFAALNRWVHELTGVHMALYALTDWLGVVPIFVAFGFALLGLGQWIGRKSLRKVDKSLRILGGFYLAVMAAYLFFEENVINYRPVFIDGRLEASYPSSTTLLVLCVMPTAAMQLKERADKRWLAAAITVFTVLMVVGRLISGVHWVTDIIGGALLSAGLVMLYLAVLP